MLSELGLTFSVCINTTGAIFKFFKVKPIPSIVLIDQEGTVVEYGVGIDGAHKIMNKANALLAS